MKGILADVNIQGYVDALVAAMRSEPWKLFWDHLGLEYLHFADLGLAPDSPDSTVWQACQERGLVLITENRNKDSTESLEAVIRAHNRATSLPIFTIANVDRLRRERQYADQIIEGLLDALLQIDALRGSGRLYLP